MSNIARFCYVNWVTRPGAGVSGSSQQITLPDDNIQNPQRVRVWEATGNTAEWMQVNLPSALPVDQLVVLDHNWTAGATVTLVGSANAGFSPPAITIDDIPFSSDYGVAAYAVPSTLSYQYWRLLVEDSGNADDIQIGYIFLGPKVDFDYRPGFNFKQPDPSVEVFSDDGQRSLYVRSKYREVRFNIGDELDLTKLTGFYRWQGKRDFILMLDPDNDQFDNVTDGQFSWTMLGSLALMEFNHRTMGVVTAPLKFREAR